VNLITGTLFWAGLFLAIVLIVGSILIDWWIPAIFALFCAVLWVFAGRFVFGAGWRPPVVVRRPTRRPVVRRARR
jgi:hypothetical protein